MEILLNKAMLKSTRNFVTGTNFTKRLGSIILQSLSRIMNIINSDRLVAS